MKMIRIACLMSLVVLASSAHAQTAPQIPTPVNPFPINPVATNGTPLPSQASKGSPYGYVGPLQKGRSVAVTRSVGEASATRLSPADARSYRDRNDVRTDADDDGLESD